MGSVWALTSAPSRHLKLEESTQEAVVAYNAPQPWHPEAGAFCTARNHMVGTYSDGPLKGQRKPWNFHHVDQRSGRIAPEQKGLVVARHYKDPLRLPSWAYG